VTVPVPVLAGVAVNVTGVLAHTGPAGLAAIATVGVMPGFTTIVMVLDAAVFDVKQVAPLIVIEQEMIVPLVRTDEVKLLVAPLCTGFPSA